MALPAYAIEILGHILLFFLVFGMSATVNLNGIMGQLQNSRAICTGAFLQFIVLPFLGFITVKMLALDVAMGITLLVLTSSPGGSYSNWWCSIFNADLALSVTMTAISTVLAVVMLPLNLYIYVNLAYKNDEEVDVFSILNFGSLITSLVVVLSAIGLGIYASDKMPHPKFHLYANRFGSAAGMSLVLLSGIASNSVNGDRIWKKDAKFYWGVALPCIIALILSNLMTTYTGLKKPERVTSCIECCYQNCGIATSVALAMFKGDDLAAAMGVPFFYGMVEFLLIGAYSIGAWKAGWTKAPPNEPFWKVVTTSYEVLLAEKIAEDAEENDGVKVELPLSHDVEVVDEYKNEPKDGTSDSHYHAHEPEMANEDPPTPSDVASPAQADKTSNEDSYVLIDPRPLFWRSLGYKVEQ